MAPENCVRWTLGQKALYPSQGWVSPFVFDHQCFQKKGLVESTLMSVLAVVTGFPGAGKTTLCKQLQERELNISCV